MFCWDASCHSVFGNWWWIVPLILMVLCVACCLAGRHRAGRGWCCGRRDRADDLDGLRREVRELKQRVGSAK